jgi:hypothetical protein
MERWITLLRRQPPFWIVEFRSQGQPHHHELRMTVITEQRVEYKRHRKVGPEQHLNSTLLH